MDNQARANPRWSTDLGVLDGKVSYLGLGWVFTDGSWSVAEQGVYTLAVDPDALASHQADRPSHMPVPLALAVGTVVPGESYSSYGGLTHDWSPDGASFVYRRRGSGLDGIWRADESGGAWSVTQLTGDGMRPGWSPTGTRIAFITAEYEIGEVRIDFMDPDGSGRSTVVPETRKTHPMSVSWSPSGDSILYSLQRQSRGLKLPSSDVYRARADGSAGTNLTKDTDAYCMGQARNSPGQYFP